MQSSRNNKTSRSAVTKSKPGNREPTSSSTGTRVGLARLGHTRSSSSGNVLEHCELSIKQSARPSPSTNQSPHPSPSIKQSPRPSASVKQSPRPSPSLKQSPHPSPSLKQTPRPSPSVNASSRPFTVIKLSPHPSQPMKESPHPSPSIKPNPRPSPSIKQSPHPSQSLASLTHKSKSQVKLTANQMSSSQEHVFITATPSPVMKSRQTGVDEGSIPRSKFKTPEQSSNTHHLKDRLRKLNPFSRSNQRLNSSHSDDVIENMAVTSQSNFALRDTFETSSSQGGGSLTSQSIGNEATEDPVLACGGFTENAPFFVPSPSLKIRSNMTRHSSQKTSDSSQGSSHTDNSQTSFKSFDNRYVNVNPSLKLDKYATTQQSSQPGSHARRASQSSFMQLSQRAKTKRADILNASRSESDIHHASLAVNPAPLATRGHHSKNKKKSKSSSHLLQSIETRLRSKGSTSKLDKRQRRNTEQSESEVKKPPRPRFMGPLLLPFKSRADGQIKENDVVTTEIVHSNCVRLGTPPPFGDGNNVLAKYFTVTSQYKMTSPCTEKSPCTMTSQSSDNIYKLSTANALKPGKSPEVTDRRTPIRPSGGQGWTPNSPLCGTPDVGGISPAMHTYGQALSAVSQNQSFFSKRVKSNLKHTKSATKLDRRKMAAAGAISPGATQDLPSDQEGSPALRLKRTMSLGRLGKKKYKHTPLTILHSPVSCVGGGQSEVMSGSRSHESLLGSPSALQHIDLTVPDVLIKPLHSSMLGDHCFQVTTSEGSKYYSCRSAEERHAWIQHLRRTIEPHQEQTRHTDNSVRIWVQEIKNIALKKRYVCEVCLDGTLYARTSTQLARGDPLFWGEQFEFASLPQVTTVTINVYREPDKKKKKEKNTLIGYVRVPVATISGHDMVEKWWPVSSATVASGRSGSSGRGGEVPQLRLRGRYHSIDILPMDMYTDLIQYLEKQQHSTLVEALEPALGVRAKEDIATCLVKILHKRQLGTQFLADIVMDEVSRIDDDSLAFRGNSIATKAMEAYVKLVAGKYLSMTLGGFIESVLEADTDCEVDPTRLTNNAALTTHQQSLLEMCSLAWCKILASHALFPKELKSVFSALRSRCEKLGRSEQMSDTLFSRPCALAVKNWVALNKLVTPWELKSVFSALRSRCEKLGRSEQMSDTLVSACIFLRFLCPAILSPSLFRLTQQLPPEKSARNLTLIAKALQTLANFSAFGDKEDYMTFLNEFVDRETSNMRNFLAQISSTDSTESALQFDGFIDLGRELSDLYSLLQTHLPKLSQESQLKLGGLKQILDTLETALNTPQHARSAISNNMAASFPRFLQQTVENQTYTQSTNQTSNQASTNSFSHIASYVTSQPTDNVAVSEFQSHTGSHTSSTTAQQQTSHSTTHVVIETKQKCGSTVINGESTVSYTGGDFNSAGVGGRRGSGATIGSIDRQNNMAASYGGSNTQVNKYEGSAFDNPHRITGSLPRSKQSNNSNAYNWNSSSPMHTANTTVHNDVYDSKNSAGSLQTYAKGYSQFSANNKNNVYPTNKLETQLMGDSKTNTWDSDSSGAFKTRLELITMEKLEKTHTSQRYREKNEQYRQNTYQSGNSNGNFNEKNKPLNKSEISLDSTAVNNASSNIAHIETQFTSQVFTTIHRHPDQPPVSMVTSQTDKTKQSTEADDVLNVLTLLTSGGHVVTSSNAAFRQPGSGNVTAGKQEGPPMMRPIINATKTDTTPTSSKFSPSVVGTGTNQGRLTEREIAASWGRMVTAAELVSGQGEPGLIKFADQDDSLEENQESAVATSGHVTSPASHSETASLAPALPPKPLSFTNPAFGMLASAFVATSSSHSNNSNNGSVASSNTARDIPNSRDARVHSNQDTLKHPSTVLSSKSSSQMYASQYGANRKNSVPTPLYPSPVTTARSISQHGGKQMNNQQQDSFSLSGKERTVLPPNSLSIWSPSCTNSAQQHNNLASESPLQQSHVVLGDNWISKVNNTAQSRAPICANVLPSPSKTVLPSKILYSDEQGVSKVAHIQSIPGNKMASPSTGRHFDDVSTGNRHGGPEVSLLPNFLGKSAQHEEENSLQLRHLQAQLSDTQRMLEETQRRFQQEQEQCKQYMRQAECTQAQFNRHQQETSQKWEASATALRDQQMSLQCVVGEKQRVIETQAQQIRALEDANACLMEALGQLRDRFMLSASDSSATESSASVALTGNSATGTGNSATAIGNSATNGNSATRHGNQTKTVLNGSAEHLTLSDSGSFKSSYC